jgi:O-antigen/teichoic acid export membrane protein
LIKFITSDRDLFNTEDIRADLKKRSLRSSMYVMIGSVLSLLLSFGSTAILARLLIPEYFGLIGMILALTVIFERFKELGLNTATVQKKDITLAQINTLFWINSGIGIGIMFLISGVSGLVAWFYEDQRLIWITISISTCFFWSGLMVQHRAILTKRMQFGRLTAADSMGSFLSIVIAVTLAIKGYGYWALVWREITRNLFTSIGIWIACPWIPGRPSKEADIRSLMRFGRDISGFNLIYYFSSSLDQILIGKFWGANILGFYRQAYQLIMLPLNYLTYPVQSVAEPAMSLLQNDDSKYRNYYRKILQLLSFVSLPLMCYILIYSKDIILMLLGDQWTAATEIFRILVLANFLRPLMATTGFIMITRGETKKYFLVGVGSSVLIIIAVSIGVIWGAMGVAWGYFISRMIFYLPMLHYSYKDTPVDMKFFFRSVSDAVIPSLIMSAAIYYLSLNLWTDISFLRIAISLPVAAAVYLLIWVILPRGTDKLKENISDFLTTFKKQ